MIEFYRDWPIWLSPEQRPVAIIRPPDGSDAVRVERNTEFELWQAVVEIIDQAFIDEHVPTISRQSDTDEFELIEMGGAEL